MTALRWEAPEHHASVGSTNAEALADPRPGRVVVAAHQTAGRGRLDRAWVSPPGTGMAISAVVPAVPAAAAGWLPLAAGLALVQALAGSRWPVAAGLKWPNDVLVPLAGGSGTAVLDVDGVRWGKVAGVLCQVAPGGAVVVGTGLNVDHTPDQLPVPTATSWRLSRGGDGGPPLPTQAREELLASYLDHLASLHALLARGAPEPVRAAYLQRSLTVGRPVTVERPDGSTARGTAAGVDGDGALVLTGSGGRSSHRAGDVRHATPQ